MRAALVSPRVRGAALAPSRVAVERVLWLAAVDRCLRVAADDPPAARAAYRDLRRLIDRCAPSLYAQTPVDGDRELAWIGTAREAIAEGAPGERAAVLVWAAVGAWTDAPSGQWGALADAALDLGDALDAGGVREMRCATKLREAMAGLWTMGGAR